jgi:formiminoglutamate deiminase
VTITKRWHAERAWLPGQGVASDVLIEAADGRFTAVTAGVARPADATSLPGLTLPGFANAHSHAFHRALRGIAGGSDFWSWRSVMYSIAERLGPDSYHRLARAVYAEMALAGISCVGEFHYLHDGANSFGHVLMEAAREAGLRITLLDACYLTSGVSGEAVTGVQRRFSDGTADGWARRVSEFGPVPEHGRLGAAIHSVRAVPLADMRVVAEWAHERAAPLHAHLSEQPAENRASLEVYGCTPAAVLDDAGALGPRATMVHATHLTDEDVRLLGRSQTTCCFCPTTEAELGDGIGPALALSAAGAPLSLGSDSQAVIDPLQETRWLEWGQRYKLGRRGVFPVTALGFAATSAGHACLGWPDAGEIVPGAHADLVTVNLASVQTASATGSSPGRGNAGEGGSISGVTGAGAAGAGVTGAGVTGAGAAAAEGVLSTALLAATAADVRHVVINGRDIVRDGRHLLVDDVAGELAAALTAVLTDR